MMAMLMRRLPRPLGYEGAADPAICAELMKGVDEHFWERNPLQCKRVIDKKADAFQLLCCVVLLIYAFMAAMSVLQSLVHVACMRYLGRRRDEHPHNLRLKTLL